MLNRLPWNRPAALAALGLALLVFAAAAPAAEPPLRIIVFGAHPDDCDLDAGGTAILWAQKGHAVKFVSLTNGDAGHQSEGGGALAKRRRAGSAGGWAPLRDRRVRGARQPRRRARGDACPSPARSSAASAAGTRTS